MMKYQYSLACLTDSGRFCNNVAAEAAYVLDLGSNDPVTGISIAQPNSTAGEVPNPCDLCFIKNLRMQAGSPYYDGPALADSSVYESKTSSCSITGMPLNNNGITGMPLNNNGPSMAYGISTAWLLMDNNLQAFCNEFPTSGTLCLVNKCPVYTVLAADTCSSIATAYNVTEPQLKARNPVINAGCYNMNKLFGTELCVGSPGKTYSTPTVTLIQPTTATTPAPVPTDVADLTSTYCGKYYMAVTGDYCNLIVLRFSISMPDFVFLNPAINVNCTNLFADESYCVQPVGDINTYPGKAGASHPVTGVQTTIPFSALPDVTPTTTTGCSTSTPSPTATGTRRDCNDYFLGDYFPSVPVGTSYNSACEFAAAVYGVDLTAFQTWNTAIDVSSASCAFQTGVRYCGKLYYGNAAPAVEEDDVLPPRDGAVSDCTEFENFYDDASTCADFLNTWHLTIAQFFTYNPEVNADCSGLWPAYQYCARAPGYVDTFPSTTTGTGTSTTTTTTTPPTGVVTPTPIQDGVISTCNKFAKAASGEYCSLFAGNNGITTAQLYLWNTVLGSNGQNCDSSFWADEYYCVGVSGTSPPATTTSTTPVQTPSPVQDGMVANCNKFALAPAGSYCSLFADNNSITTAQLYTWNSVLGPNGENCGTSFWANEYYCAGVSS
ncbi:hypothetical protein VF21_01031 [Pseudogymnoascus sp. 05NY08]|nr:hypothetical protein VF21_01031 [Pseudogymnoascus sp. 05NY08]